MSQMMALGLFVFSLPTLAYQQLQRQRAWQHASHSRVGTRAAYQYTGPGEESITLSGLIAPDISGTAASLSELQALADAGQPLPLVDGTGKVHGAYVIQHLNETHSLFFPDGRARKIEFELSLLRVNDPLPMDTAA